MLGNIEYENKIILNINLFHFCQSILRYTYETLDREILTWISILFSYYAIWKKTIILVKTSYIQWKQVDIDCIYFAFWHYCLFGLLVYAWAVLHSVYLSAYSFDPLNFSLLKVLGRSLSGKRRFWKRGKMKLPQPSLKLLQCTTVHFKLLMKLHEGETPNWDNATAVEDPERK